MPPKRKAAKQSAPSTDASVRPFIARLARQQLEQILEEAVTSGAAPTLESIKSMLPEAKRTQQIQRVNVAAGEERTGTGLFDGLDVELLVAILRLTGLKQRIHCATVVCKAWTQLQGYHELFTDLELVPAVERYGMRGTTKLNIVSAKLLNFVQWLPKHGEEVEKLGLDTGDKHHSLSPDVTKKLLPQLPGLTSLDLSGKKVTTALLTVAAKQPFAARLTSFSLSDGAAKASDSQAALRLHRCWFRFRP